MGDFNIPPDQQQAIAAIDTKELSKLVEDAVRTEQSSDLRRLLAGCGTYIATELRYFEQALARHSEARATRKREQTAYDVRKLASDLSSAVWAMKRRVEEDVKDAQLFFVDDHIIPPHRFSKHLDVKVRFRWRQTPDEEWKFGSITFTHEVDLRPDFTVPKPSRKPSKAKQERDLQTRLYDTWDHLKTIALCSVRDYFKAGGDGETIPETFQATVDSCWRGLNNFSADFWGQRSENSAVR